MQYRDKVTGEVEWVYNSRDGVTPFGITSRHGNEAIHVNWQQDRYDPTYVPQIGERIFVDLTLERALEFRRAQVERYWDHPQYPMSGQWASKEEAARELAETDLRCPGQPIVVVVTEGIIAWIKNSDPARRSTEVVGTAAA